MPLVFFDVIKGKTETELKQILDVSHKVFVETLDIPDGIAIRFYVNMNLSKWL